ncbi:unnamed protein product [Orchesella dallaii]|uniref:Gustatory receptor n=1 Tax=Orchesella dallaii TaxID=48710 RepID=A0ABP1S699_9HEXA
MFRRKSTKGSKRRRRKVSSEVNGGDGSIKSFCPNLEGQSEAIETTSLEDDHLAFKLLILLETFLNVCFFLLLVPFRIGRNSQGFFETKRNCIQQTLSTLLITLIILYSVLDLRWHLEYSLKENPEDTFSQATGVLYHMISICWGLTFWLRGDCFDDLLSVCQYHTHHKQLHFIAENTSITSKNLSWKLILFLKIAMLLTFARFLNSVYYLCNGSIEGYLNYVIGNTLYNLYVRHDKQTEIETEVRLNSTLLNSAAYALVPIDVLFEFIGIIFEQFCLTGAVITYAACENFSEKFEKSSVSSNGNCSASQTQTVIKGIISSYLDLISTIASINKVFGPSILLFFMKLYPLFIWSAFNRVENDSVSEIMMKWLDMAYLVSFIGIAATANAKVSGFKGWLFNVSMADFSLDQQRTLHRSSPGSESLASVKETDSTIFSHDAKVEMKLALAAMHREMSTEVIGLKGWNLFTITYSFLVTMVGVVITYAIVMLQFTMTIKPLENDTLKNCSVCNITESSTTENFTEHSFIELSS